MTQPAAIVEPLAPATLTDMLDGGWRLLHRRPGTLLGLSALFLVPSAVLAGLGAAAADTDVQNTLGLQTFSNGSVTATSLLATVLSAALRSLGVMYLGVALTYVVMAAMSGQALGAVDAAKAAFRRSGAVLGSWPLLALVSIVAYVACFLPLAVWLTFTAVVAPVIAAEGVGPIAAIGRSFSLIARRFWMSLGVVLLASLVAWVLGTVLGSIPQLLASLLPWGAQWAVTTVVTAFSAALITGPLVITSVLLYLDLRVRTEGLDLRQRAPPPPSPVPADSDEARRVAEQILSAPEYQEPAQPWWQKALDKIDDLFQRIFSSLSGGGGGSVVVWVILIIALAAAVAIVVLAVRSIRRSRGRRAQPDEDPSPRRRRRPPEVDWQAQVAELEAAGRWREGLRARYRALATDLSRHRVIDPAVSRTTGEHRQEVGAVAPDAAAEFGDAAELFDRAWYGNRPTGPEEAERFGELARRVGERTR